MRNSVALVVGGGVRVGLEDDIWCDSKRTNLDSNAERIKRIHFLAVSDNSILMSSEDFSQKLNFEGGNGKYNRISDEKIIL